MGVDILEEFSLGMLEMEVQISGGNDQLHMGHFHNSISVHKLHIKNHIVSPINSICEPSVGEQVSKMVHFFYAYVSPFASVLEVHVKCELIRKYLEVPGLKGTLPFLRHVS